MRRREVLAGAVGAAAVGGAGLAITLDTDWLVADEEDEDYADDPVTVETIDAPGSKAGEITVPNGEDVQVVEFFATTCQTCTAMKPEVAAAAAATEDATFLSVTNEGADDETLRGYWNDVDGNWALGVDPTSELFVRYDGVPVPTMVALDTRGRVRWEHTGSVTEEEILEGVERAQSADA